MSAQEQDADLVARARQGDAEAFGVLVARYQRLLTSVAYGILGDSGRTEDAVQDAFVSAWQALPQYRGEANFRNWLCRILVNKAHSAHRWARVRRWLSLDAPASEEGAAIDPADPSAAADPERGQLEQERDRQIREAVAGLPLKQRTAVLLRAGGLDVAAVAESMAVAEGTVKATLFQARANLEKSLGKS